MEKEKKKKKRFVFFVFLFFVRRITFDLSLLFVCSFVLGRKIDRRISVAIKLILSNSLDKNRNTTGSID